MILHGVLHPSSMEQAGTQSPPTGGRQPTNRGLCVRVHHMYSPQSNNTGCGISQALGKGETKCPAHK
jgi:hypothetical protein